MSFSRCSRGAAGPPGADVRGKSTSAMGFPRRAVSAEGQPGADVRKNQTSATGIKRFTAALAAAAFLVLTVLSTAGCAGGAPSSPPPVEVASEDLTTASAALEEAQEAATAATEAPAIIEEELPKATVQTSFVGICLSRTENGDNERLITELPRALELRGFSPENILEKKMTGSRGRQNKEIDGCLEQGCRVLIISAVDDAQIPGIADRVCEAGAMAVFVNCTPDGEEISRWKELSMPCVWLGVDGGQETMCRMGILHDYSGTERGLDFNGDGHVGAVLVGSDKEARAALKETMRDIGSKLRVLGETDSTDSQEISDYLQEIINERQKEVELVLCGEEGTALAAADGVQLRHRLVGRDILVIGSDAHEESCTAIINKLMSGSVFKDFYEQAYLCAGAAKDLLEGNQGENFIPTVIFKVTEENAQEVLDQLWKAREAFEAAEEERREREAAEAAAAAAASAEAATSSAAAASAEAAASGAADISSEASDTSGTESAAAVSAEAADTGAAADEAAAVE